jgi:hypothetical protein
VADHPDLLAVLHVRRAGLRFGCAIDMVTQAGKGTRFSVIISETGGNASCRVEPDTAAASM